jgi:TrmH family RNA methyltransferase
MNKPQASAQSVEQVLARVRSLSVRARRESEQCFWIEGIRNFVAACDARFQFEAIVHSPVLLKSPLVEMLIRRLGSAGVRRVKASPEQFRSVHSAGRASGIGAIVRQRWTSLDETPRRRGLGWLVVESIRSPGNLGTILRTADAVGVTGVVFVGEQCDPFEPTVVRSGMGGLFNLPLVRTNPHDLARWARARQIGLVGLSPKAPDLWTGLGSEAETALVIGEERSGLSKAMQEICHRQIRLPMTGRADSLNVAVAAGVAMYELVRQMLAKRPEEMG